jgi:nucleoside-diphosphate-sugar epimerase
MATILVTGAAGFIGSALTRALSRAGHDVVTLQRADGDITEKATWARLPAVTHVFHLAARSYVPDSWRDPAAFFHTNVTGAIQALEYCRANGTHLVFASGYVYGLPSRLPIREDDPTAPNNPYALSKYLAEQICAFYAATGLPVTVVRPFNIFGPGQRREFLIPTILEQVRTRERIQVKDLTPRRDYLFIDDFVTALMFTIEQPGGHRVLNIGSGISYSVREVIDVIQLAAGTSLPVVGEESPRPNEISETRADITRAQTLLGWSPRYTFAEGIERLLAAER